MVNDNKTANTIGRSRKGSSSDVETTKLIGKNEVKEDNEWSLAYYSMTHEKLFYKVENFEAWLKILVTCKNEVISELDKDFILELG